MTKDYGLNCPVARALDKVGERWTLLICRDLFLFGPRRFRHFERSLRGIGPNTLSARLQRLEDEGIVTRTYYSHHPPRAEYSLTEKGRTLWPVLDALRTWGERHGATRS